ncbi:MAG: pyridoxine 5'-phosphate synthase [Deltaproteobacteria bacterium]|jgi:pyridoxine 5-phosphate synthase|nr:pyridoxine 5'-phosphate synthase [Deltaproteobacteria bacterium]MBW2535524.1 pyridoxine 5'-phosphate synthase [Deltaproteobacteria bacterium]
MARLWLTLEQDAAPPHRAWPDAGELARRVSAAGVEGIALEIGETTSDGWLQQYRAACADAGLRVMARVPSTVALVERACQLGPEAMAVRWAAPDDEPADPVAVLGERMARASSAVERIRRDAVPLALLIPPDRADVDTAHLLGVGAVLLDAACHPRASLLPAASREALTRLRKAAVRAHELGLQIGVTGRITEQSAVPLAAVGVVDEIHLGRAFLQQVPAAELAAALRRLRDALR